MRPAHLVSFFRLTLAGSLGLVFLGGCSSKPKAPATAATAATAQPRTIHVGEVTVVDDRKRFVLIDLQSNLYVPEPGVTLRTMRDATETAKLQVAPERKRPFIAADVIKGEPAVGDQVLQ